MQCVRMVVEVMMIRCYSELIKLDTFEERFNYLKLGGTVGSATFGFDRYLNQMLYTSKRWRKIRDEIIIRDKACDLGMDDYELHSKILIHHMNPISSDGFDIDDDDLYNPEYLICTCLDTHNAIHFGDESRIKQRLPIERKRNDTCPWK